MDNFEIMTCLSCGNKNKVQSSKKLQAVCGICKNKLFTSATFYDILEITQDGTTDDIKKAYRRLAMKWHPDKNPDKLNVATEKFKLINEAYSVLSNTEKRKIYDESLTGKNNTYTNKESNIDFDVATQIFFNEMYGLAMEMAFQNNNWSKIYPHLIEKGCPENIATVISQQCVLYRKAIIRNISLRSFIKAAAWFAVGGIISFITGANWIFWIMFFYGGHYLIVLLKHLITGTVPIKNYEHRAPLYKKANMNGKTYKVK